ncbi:TlpA family protein disulfide reductase [Polaribacter pectinis]|uniref:TlpA family protein disulfide reductase n=1 Tax=Polaribacter pectinis TaxID=2738844 RepID=A0A7G9L8K2_9FLAO|nr:TlpA disulfide reductase family protein [Polaribacter pectinis]QNM84951.1 TlpA family protein disulfide reductase [Polaribacter pectinis]
MKKILAFIFLVTSFVQAQHTLKGTMTPALESDWIILYKIEGARQKFIKNSKIKIDSVTVDGTKRTVGHFSFEFPENTKVGSYRVTYRTEEAGFVDFIFNKEDVSFAFHPDYPEQSVVFSKSEENIIYREYLSDISVAQQKLDSLQITALKNPDVDLKAAYVSGLQKINSIQQEYLKATENKYVNPFIKATLRANAKELQTTPKMYMSNMINTFFNNMDFSDKTLLNSSFLVDRITDYVFYINYSENKETQQKLYKNSIQTVLNKITDLPFKKDVIEFLIAQFENSKNLELLDYLFESHYKKLPEGLQNKNFINEKMALFATEIGRTAPDFSWIENGKNLTLSKLDEAKNYVLVFWSTDCSHCLKEIPQLYTFLQDKKDIKVVAFSLERNDFGWNNMKTTLPNWHHVLGLNKWENKIARTYNIMATPTYFVLDANKKIIAKPEELKDVKEYLDKL